MERVANVQQRFTVFLLKFKVGFKVEAEKTEVGTFNPKRLLFIVLS